MNKNRNGLQKLVSIDELDYLKLPNISVLISHNAQPKLMRLISQIFTKKVNIIG
jgi:hypothetical protein